MTPSGLQQEDEPSATVEAYLRAHPGFLSARPGLYAVLHPPQRLHGETLADHMHAQLRHARARADMAERATADAAATRRDTEGFTRRVQAAVLAMLRTPDAAWLTTDELASFLCLDQARLCSEADPLPPGHASLPRGTIESCLGRRPALLRTALPATASLLHGEAFALASQEALVRIPSVRGTALLALCARDRTGLAGATTDALAFLGQAIAAALDRVP